MTWPWRVPEAPHVAAVPGGARGARAARAERSRSTAPCVRRGGSRPAPSRGCSEMLEHLERADEVERRRRVREGRRRMPPGRRATRLRAVFQCGAQLPRSPRSTPIAGRSRLLGEPLGHDALAAADVEDRSGCRRARTASSISRRKRSRSAPGQRVAGAVLVRCVPRRADEVGCVRSVTHSPVGNETVPRDLRLERASATPPPARSAPVSSMRDARDADGLRVADARAERATSTASRTPMPPGANTTTIPRSSPRAKAAVK